MTDIIATLRRRASSDDRAMLDQLQQARASLAAILLRGIGQDKPEAYKAEIKKLQEQVERLEAQVSARSLEFRSQSQPVTIEAIQKALPAEAALVEFTAYKPLTRPNTEATPPAARANPGGLRVAAGAGLGRKRNASDEFMGGFG